MMRFSAIAVGLMLALAPPLASTLAAQDRSIIVEGTGTVLSAPDMAVISLGVAHQSKDAAAAMQAVSDKVAAILTALTDAGIAPRDIQTRNISVSAVWGDTRNNQPRQITGFEASNTLSVRVRLLDSLGFVIDTVLAKGANRMNGLTFGLNDDSGVVETARRAAVHDAMAKAALYAEAAGVPLGPVLEISEITSAPRMMRMEAMAADIRSSGAPVAAGELSMESQVRMVFGIVDSMADAGAEAGSETGSETGAETGSETGAD